MRTSVFSPSPIVAVHERDVLLLVDVVLVADDAPRSVIGRQPRLGDAMHETLVLEPVRDELRDRDERDAVLLRELLELRTARRRSVLVEDLANHSRRQASGQPREIDRGFGVSDALEHAAVARAQRKHVAAVAEIARNRRRIDGDANRRRAILRADARRHAEARRRIDR